MIDIADAVGGRYGPRRRVTRLCQREGMKNKIPRVFDVDPAVQAQCGARVMVYVNSLASHVCHAVLGTGKYAIIEAAEERACQE